MSAEKDKVVAIRSSFVCKKRELYARFARGKRERLACMRFARGEAGEELYALRARRSGRGGSCMRFARAPKTTYDVVVTTFSFPAREAHTAPLPEHNRRCSSFNLLLPRARSAYSTLLFRARSAHTAPLPEHNRRCSSYNLLLPRARSAYSTFGVSSTRKRVSIQGGRGAMFSLPKKSERVFQGKYFFPREFRGGKTPDARDGVV